MGLFSRDKPKIKVQSTKKDGFSGWLKCTNCHELIHTKELEGNLNCCPKCDYHYRLSVEKRIESLVDSGSFQELFVDITPVDPLNFVDTETYKERLEKAQAKAGRPDGIVVGKCRIEETPCLLGVMDFAFMGGSMGSVIGEKITRLIEYGITHRLGVILVSASGGARMQESILSLMQMAKTSAALARLDLAGLPYISVLTNPTSGGVTASFASLGDVILAEPGALICFAGPRVIEQTIKEKLPATAQKSEFLLEHGMVDRVVARSELRKTLGSLISHLTHAQGKIVSLQQMLKKSSPQQVSDPYEEPLGV